MTRCESISPLDITTHADLSLYSSALITGLRFTASSDTIVCKTERFLAEDSAHVDQSLYCSALITGLRFTASSDTIECKTGRDFSLKIPRMWI
ncbi:hypothetical protein RRG08_016032 [Elysia crispata]|uniref:Uncharacterized protein n=1 Tax=Elysia crispata TaxID=231223 RepID=A0AAE1B4B7_9GAST|nr:hypothetical protein RRG08_016032 [Elysia crispata]